MRILWLCNIVLPSIAADMGLKVSNKEGWISGIADRVKKSHDFELGIAFPVPIKTKAFTTKKEGISYFAFNEDTVNPDLYDAGLEPELKSIVETFNPDLVHIFGTEFPHALAICKVMKDSPEKLLVGIQGIVTECTKHYADGLPQKVIRRRTFRDFIRKDNIKDQINKFAKRADNEAKALEIVGNITGRTSFDKTFTESINPKAKYYHMNETLRSVFYDSTWARENCNKHSIFLSQGNYPIKGVHYVFEALPLIKKKYPDVSVRIAGDIITSQASAKDKMKISSYGKYLLQLVKKYKLEDSVKFIGNIDAEGMKSELLSSDLFICPSTVENSPNSLGEAMLLGVPAIAANVGGISSVFFDQEDGILYRAGDVNALFKAVDLMWSGNKTDYYSKNAVNHARLTHNPDINYKRLLEIYSEIIG